MDKADLFTVGLFVVQHQVVPPAWWIAFAPFVGLFLARISRGRTIREFVLGGILVPTLMCFVWMAFLGGTALDMETSGQAAGGLTAIQKAMIIGALPFSVVMLLMHLSMLKALFSSTAGVAIPAG